MLLRLVVMLVSLWLIRRINGSCSLNPDRRIAVVLLRFWIHLDERRELTDRVGEVMVAEGSLVFSFGLVKG